MKMSLSISSFFSGFAVFALSHSAMAGCIETSYRTHPEWRPIDRQYVCTARNVLPLDSDMNYNRCVARMSARSGDGELIINTCLSGGGGGSGGGIGCIEQTYQSHPEWRPIDRQYVCTARHTMRLDSDPSYTRCVIDMSYRTGDGEVIIDACRTGGEYGCIARTFAPHPEWRAQDRNYVCSARNRIAIDSNAAYTNCVISVSYRTGNGEEIIDSCYR